MDKNRQRDIYIGYKKAKQIIHLENRQTDGQTDKQTDRQTCRQVDRQKDGLTGKKTDGSTGSHK